MTLDVSIVEEDHRLEQAADTSHEALAHHRWHHTLDETNPDRVSINAYAKAVARNESTMRRVVKGYAAWRSGGTGRTLNEEIRMASRSVEVQAATQAVAEAKGTTLGAAERGHRDEIRRVRDTARERAEQRGTTVTDEIPTVAAEREKTRRSNKRLQDERSKRLDARFVEVERHLLESKRRVLRALQVARDIEWTDEHRELITETVGDTRAVLDLLELHVAGTVEIDWDADLKGLTL